MELKSRPSKKTGEILYTLDEVQLTVNKVKKNKIDRIPLIDIRKVNLQIMSGVPTCKIKTIRNEKFVISGRIFIKMGKIDENRENYNNFVNDFHQKLSSRNNNVDFMTGSNAFFITGIITCFITIAMVILGVATDAPIRLYTKSLVLLAFSLPMIFMGPAKTYQPDAIPEKFLPK